MKQRLNLIVLFVTSVLLVACGDTSSLKEENEMLKAEIETLKASQQTEEFVESEETANLEVAEQEIVQLAPKEGDIDVKTTEEEIEGEWNTFSEFFGQEEEWNFHSDGTGTQLVTMYVHNTTFEVSLGDPNDTGIDLYNFNWTFENGIGKITYIDPNNQYGNNLDFIVTEGEFRIVYEGKTVEKYSRDKATIPVDYVTANSIILQQNAQASQFLGQWYFDVFIWTFHPDGTLIIDVPAFGQHPANQLEYSYFIQSDPFNEADALISIIDSTGGFSMYEAILGDQESLTLQPRSDGNSILLTKSYSLQNSPITSDILDEGMALFDAFETFSSLLGKRR